MCAIIPKLLRRGEVQKAKETMISLALLIVANKLLIWSVNFTTRSYRCADFLGDWEWRGCIGTCIVDWRGICCCWAAQLCKQRRSPGSRSFILCFLSAASPSPAFAVVLCGTEPAGSTGAGTAHYISQVLAPLKRVSCKMKVILMSVTSIWYY